MSNFISVIAFVSRHVVAIESWPEWDLNPRPLNSVQRV